MPIGADRSCLTLHEGRNKRILDAAQVELARRNYRGRIRDGVRVDGAGGPRGFDRPKD